MDPANQKTHQKIMNIIYTSPALCTLRENVRQQGHVNNVNYFFCFLGLGVPPIVPGLPQESTLLIFRVLSTFLETLELT